MTIKLNRSIATYPVRDIIAMEQHDVWQLPVGVLTIKFDDGNVDLTTEQVIISWYYWLMHRECPGAPIRTTHCFTDHFTSDVHQKLGETLLNDIAEYHGNDADIFWKLSRLYYELTNLIYNDAYADRLTRYQPSACILDVIDILDHDELVSAKKKYIKTVEDANYEPVVVEPAIKDVQKVVKTILFERPDEMVDNGIKILCNSKAIGDRQVNQMVGIRGYPKDIDGGVFRYPINSSYIEGLKTLYDSATESRSAATSKFFTEAPLETSEHFNKIMQQHCAVIHSIVGDSCSDFKTIEWYVDPDQEALLTGSYHMVDDVPVLINSTNFKLISGKKIQLRNILGCNNHDPQTVCRTCIGKVASAIPKGTNVGWALAGALLKLISQRMLSNKHYEASSFSIYLHLADRHRKWLRQDLEDKSIFYLERGLKRVRMYVTWSSAPRLNQVSLANVEDLAPSRITCCKTVTFAEVDESGNIHGVPVEVDMAVAGSGAYFSHELLHYLSRVGWSSRSDVVEIDLTQWDRSKPLLMTPRRGENIFLYLMEIKSFIVSAGEKGDQDRKTNVTSYLTRPAALAEFVSIIRSRAEFTSVSIACMSILVRACMCRDPAAGDYRLPRANEAFQFVNANRILQKRSLSCALDYQSQDSVIIDPEWYVDRKRMPYVYDPILYGDK